MQQVLMFSTRKNLHIDTFTPVSMQILTITGYIYYMANMH